LTVNKPLSLNFIIFIFTGVKIRMEPENTTANESKKNIGNVFCGSMDESGFALWDNCEFWCEGILLSVVGAVGLLGNVGSIAVLATR
jgi:hypothetical protein